MGTRNLTVIVNNNEIKVAQYCQWDGYPSGQGKKIVDFILNKYKPEKFKKKLNKITWINDYELNNRWKSVGAKGDMVTFAIADKFKEKYYWLSRNCGADILECIQDDKFKVDKVSNNLDFANDSLFCEYSYVLNLDDETLEIYEGFNTDNLNNSNNFPYVEFKKDKDEKYSQVKLHSIFPFEVLDDLLMDHLEDHLSGE